MLGYLDFAWGVPMGCVAVSIVIVLLQEGFTLLVVVGARLGSTFKSKVTHQHPSIHPSIHMQTHAHAYTHAPVSLEISLRETLMVPCSARCKGMCFVEVMVPSTRSCGVVLDRWLGGLGMRVGTKRGDDGHKTRAGPNQIKSPARTCQPHKHPFPPPQPPLHTCILSVPYPVPRTRRAWRSARGRRTAPASPPGRSRLASPRDGETRGCGVWEG